MSPPFSWLLQTFDEKNMTVLSILNLKLEKV